MTCENALSESNLSPNDIQEVILAGGSTRMPCIRKSVKKIFNKDPKTSENPDEAIALGAALFVAYKSDKSKLTPLQQRAISKVNITEITNKYFGTAIAGINATKEDLEIFNDILINKGEKVPCSVTKKYVTINDGQTKLDCTVNESNDAETDLEFVTKIWEGTLELPPGRLAGQPVEVTFSYNENQTMECEFLDVTSKKKMKIDLSVDNDNLDTDIDIDDFKVEIRNSGNNTSFIGIWFI